MDSVENKVAVVTGGASGMGLAFAQRFGKAGARIAIADVEEPALNAAVAELEAAGVEAFGVVTDVADEASMEALASAVIDRFGTVNLLFNNAGVASTGPVIETTLTDWKWVTGVNLFGVVHGLHFFLPTMLEHGDAHIVNTASIAGHTSFANMSVYNVTKHSVVTLSETLLAELQQAESSVGVSVLCPGLVNTRILESDRNRPEVLSNPGMAPEPTAEQEQIRELARALFADAKSPEAVADLVYDAVLNNQFWIFTDDEYNQAVETRHKSIRDRINPQFVGGLIDEE